MGALHEGHLSLCRRSIEENETTVVSIYVNPLQFGPNEDLSKYPRPLEKDLSLLNEIGTDYAFLPEPEELTVGLRTSVSVEGVTTYYEGERRPGHFDGVATIVCKLFNIVQPDRAYFGLKDLQQCAVIRTMCRDLNMDISLQFLETIREPTGLALSSRNTYLTDDNRERAALLHKSLINIANALQNDPTSYQSALYDVVSNLKSNEFEVEYLDIVDPETMNQTSPDNANARLVVAAKFMGVRLIDNVPAYQI